MAHLISALLFGDGAAATIVVGSEVESNGPEILATKSILYPNSERVMGWDISEKGFRIVLSPEVPDTVIRHLGEDVDTFLTENGYSRSDIKSWVMHTGGPKVLEATATALGITARILRLRGIVCGRWGTFLPHPSSLFWKTSIRTAGRAGDSEYSGCDGTRILLGIRSSAVVNMARSTVHAFGCRGHRRGPGRNRNGDCLQFEGTSRYRFDSRKPPIDKPCGEGLLPKRSRPCIASESRSTPAPFPFSGLRFSDEYSSATARIAEDKLLACAGLLFISFSLIVLRSGCFVSVGWQDLGFRFSRCRR